jgi:hypothetical protein
MGIEGWCFYMITVSIIFLIRYIYTSKIMEILHTYLLKTDELAFILFFYTDEIYNWAFGSI